MTVYNSSDITKGVPARMGVYGTKNVGVITVASNITLGSSPQDILNICYIPNYSFMSNFMMWGLGQFAASMQVSLQDSLTTTTTYIAAFTTGVATPVASVTTILNFDKAVVGAQYGSTAVAIAGAPGTVEKVWVSGALLQLVVTTSASATTGATALNLSYIVEWSPTYQAT